MFFSHSTDANGSSVFPDVSRNLAAEFAEDVEENIMPDVDLIAKVREERKERIGPATPPPKPIRVRRERPQYPSGYFAWGVTLPMHKWPKPTPNCVW